MRATHRLLRPGVTVFQSSVIRKTGQWPKFVASVAALISGGAAMFFAVREMPTSAATPVLVLFLGGAAASLGSAIFACIAIRCPSCGARWFWAAVSKQETNHWLPWLMSQPTCPSCSFPGGTVSETSDKAA